MDRCSSSTISAAFDINNSRRKIYYLTRVSCDKKQTFEKFYCLIQKRHCTYNILYSIKVNYYIYCCCFRYCCCYCRWCRWCCYNFDVVVFAAYDDKNDDDDDDDDDWCMIYDDATKDNDLFPWSNSYLHKYPESLFLDYGKPEQTISIPSLGFLYNIIFFRIIRHSNHALISLILKLPDKLVLPASPWLKLSQSLSLKIPYTKGI